MNDNELAAKVVSATFEYLKGCSNTDPVLGGTGDPADCEDCLAAFVNHIRILVTRDKAIVVYGFHKIDMVACGLLSAMAACGITYLLLT